MALLLENYGLDAFCDDDKAGNELMHYIVHCGTAKYGYRGLPYIFTPMGNLEFWTKTKKSDDDEHEFSVSEINIHCGNQCVWEAVLTGIDITPKKDLELGRLAFFKKTDGTGSDLPIEVLNADVIPSWMENDRITMQVVAMPLDIEYYHNEEEYTEAQPTDKNGKKWTVATGAMVPLAFFINHSPETYDKNKEYPSDRQIQFTAVVKKLYHGEFEIGDKRFSTFIRCIAETEYGELEFDHTIDQVPEKMRDNIHEGAIISGTCIIYADVAIKEYEHGIVKDFDNDLKLLRYTLECGNAERLCSVLRSDSVYESDNSDSVYVGAKKIVDRFTYVHNKRKGEYKTYYATLTGADTDMDYPIDTRCIILADSETDEYESIAFIDVDEDGMISKIKISTDSRYLFKLQLPEKIKSPLDDCKFPDNVLEPIILRARFHGIIDDDIEAENITESIDNYQTLERNARLMLETLDSNAEADCDSALPNIIGYLFAKAIENTVNAEKNRGTSKTGLLSHYSPCDAFEGKLSSTLPQNQHTVLENAMELGKEFYNDLKAYCEIADVDEEGFTELFLQVAVVVQRLGEIYSEHCFDR